MRRPWLSIGLLSTCAGGNSNGRAPTGARTRSLQRYVLRLTTARASYDADEAPIETAAGAPLGRDRGSASPRRWRSGHMRKVTTTDGVEIFYKDWGSGQPI